MLLPEIYSKMYSALFPLGKESIFLNVVLKNRNNLKYKAKNYIKHTMNPYLLVEI